MGVTGILREEKQNWRNLLSRSIECKVGEEGRAVEYRSKKHLKRCPGPGKIARIRCFSLNFRTSLGIARIISVGETEDPQIHRCGSQGSSSLSSNGLLDDSGQGVPLLSWRTS